MIVTSLSVAFAAAVFGGIAAYVHKKESPVSLFKSAAERQADDVLMQDVLAREGRLTPNWLASGHVLAGETAAGNSEAERRTHNATMRALLGSIIPG